MQRSPHFLIPAEAGNLSVDQTQGVSLYIQVANILRYAILSGAIAPGSRLPTVVELGDHFKVARITIREAIRVLAEEGLLVSSRGRGIHVLQHPSQSKPAPQIADAMDADVSSVEIVILAVDDLTTVPADMLKEAIAFPTYKGITKIHKFEGRPLGLIRICVADSIYRRLPKGAIEKKNVLPMVRALPAVGALELKLIITVEPADVVLADHLRCPLGAPVARVLRRAIDTKGRGVYLALSWYRGDMFSFAATIPNELLPHLSTGIDGTL